LSYGIVFHRDGENLVVGKSPGSRRLKQKHILHSARPVLASLANELVLTTTTFLRFAVRSEAAIAGKFGISRSSKVCGAISRKIVKRWQPNFSATTATGRQHDANARFYSVDPNQLRAGAFCVAFLDATNRWYRRDVALLKTHLFSVC